MAAPGNGVRLGPGPAGGLVQVTGSALFSWRLCWA